MPLTPRERLRAGAKVLDNANPFIMAGAPPKILPSKLLDAKLSIVHAQPKPWGDKESGPYPGNDDEDGGHYGGDISEPFRDAPGEEVKVPPKSSPTSDTLNLRASLEAAVEASTDPDVQFAMRAIEARLAEITQFMKNATRGATKDMTIKLGVLAHII